jgi:hypothetical protein
MECLWGNTSIIIPQHERRPFCGKEQEKSLQQPQEKQEGGMGAATGS